MPISRSPTVIYVGRPGARFLSACSHGRPVVPMRKQTTKTLLLLLALCSAVFGVGQCRRAHDLSPLLGVWNHPQETLALHADGTLIQNLRRSNTTARFQRRWYRVGDEIYIEGAVGYNQWLRCRWQLMADHKTLTLTKYYESGEVVTMSYQWVAP